MRRAQLLLSAERRHTPSAPHLFGNQSAPFRPCISASFSLRHRATLLYDDHLPQDVVHVALTNISTRAINRPDMRPQRLNYFDHCVMKKASPRNEVRQPCWDVLDRISVNK